MQRKNLGRSLNQAMRDSGIEEEIVKYLEEIYIEYKSEFTPSELKKLEKTKDMHMTEVINIQEMIDHRFFDFHFRDYEFEKIVLGKFNKYEYDIYQFFHIYDPIQIFKIGLFSENFRLDIFESQAKEDLKLAKKKFETQLEKYNPLLQNKFHVPFNGLFNQFLRFKGSLSKEKKVEIKE